MKIFKQKQSFLVRFEPTSLTLQTDQNITMKLVFQRGDASPEQTKTVTITQGANEQTIPFLAEQFQKECTFFYDKTKVEPKKASIRLVRIFSGKESIMFETEIDLAMNFGKAFERAFVNIVGKPELVNNGIRFKRFDYNCVISCLKPKHQETYNQLVTFRQQIEARLKAEQDLMQLRQQIPQMEKKRQEEIKQQTDLRRTVPIASKGNDFNDDQIRYSQRVNVQNKLAFDPTEGLEDDFADQFDDDPFAQMQRDREQSIKMRMSTADDTNDTRTSTQIIDEETKFDPTNKLTKPPAESRLKTEVKKPVQTFSVFQLNDQKAKLEEQRKKEKKIKEQQELELKRLEKERQEQERIESDRREAELAKQRIIELREEAARNEQAKRDEDAARARQFEIEQQQRLLLEAQKREKEAQETARLEAMRLQEEERLRQQEAQRIVEEQAKQQARIQAEEAAQKEQLRLEQEAETLRQEQLRQEKERAEAARLEQLKLEKERAEALRLEKLRQDQERAEAFKQKQLLEQKQKEEQIKLQKQAEERKRQEDIQKAAQAQKLREETIKQRELQIAREQAQAKLQQEQQAKLQLARLAQQAKEPAPERRATVGTRRIITDDDSGSQSDEGDKRPNQEQIKAQQQKSLDLKRQKEQEFLRKIEEQKRLESLEEQRLIEEQKRIEQLRLQEQKQVDDQRLKNELRAQEEERLRKEEAEQMAQLESMGDYGNEVRLSMVEEGYGYSQQMDYGMEEYSNQMAEPVPKQVEESYKQTKQFIIDDEIPQEDDKERALIAQREEEERRRIEDERQRIEEAAQDAEIADLRSSILAEEEKIKFGLAQSNRLQEIKAKCSDIETQIRQDAFTTNESAQKLGVEILSLKTQIAKIQSQVSEVDSDNQRIQAEMQEPQEAIAQTEAEIMGVQAEIKQLEAEIIAISEKNEELRKTLEQETAEGQNEEKQLGSLKDAQVQLDERTIELTTQTATYLQSKQENESSLDRFQSELEDLDRQNAAASHDLSSLQVQLDLDRSEKQTLEQDYQSLLSEHKTLLGQAEKDKQTLLKVKLQGDALLKVTENMHAYMREVEDVIASQKKEKDQIKAVIEQAAKEKKAREIEELKKQVQELEAKKKAEYDAAFALAKQKHEEEVRLKKEQEEREMLKEQERMARKEQEIQELEQKLQDGDGEEDYGSDDGGINFDNLDSMLEARATQVMGRSIVQPKPQVVEQPEQDRYEDEGEDEGGINFDNLDAMLKARATQVIERRTVQTKPEVVEAPEEDQYADDEPFNFDQLVQERQMSLAMRGNDESDILQISRMSGAEDEPDEDNGNFSLAEAMQRRTNSTPQKLDPRVRTQLQEKSPHVQARFDSMMQLEEQHQQDLQRIRQAELDRIQAEKQEAERVRLEQERLEGERIRLELERQEAERIRLEFERREAERIRLEIERREAERIRIELERQEAERQEKERQAEELARLAAERLRAQQEAERVEREQKKEAERVETERLKREQEEREQAELARVERLKQKQLKETELAAKIAQEKALKLKQEEQEKALKAKQEEEKRKKSFSVFNSNVQKINEEKKQKALKEAQKKAAIEKQRASTSRELELMEEEFQGESTTPVPQVQSNQRISEPIPQGMTQTELKRELSKINTKRSSQTQMQAFKGALVKHQLSQIEESQSESSSYDSSDSNEDHSIYDDKSLKPKKQKSQPKDTNTEVFGAVGPSDPVEKSTSIEKSNGSVQIAQKTAEVKPALEESKKDPIVPIAVNQDNKHEARKGLPFDLLDASFQDRGSYFRASIMNRSSDSFFGTGRESVYRATVYDRQGGPSKMSKKAKVDLVVRELYVSLIAGVNLFVVTSDYETMEGFRVFQKMLQADDKSHEAMFGLGQLNFKIQRYEIAEYWFVKAYTLHRDISYRLWLGVTYMKLFELLPITNQNKAKFASFAAKNLQRCAEDANCTQYALFGLILLAASVQLHYPKQPKIDGLFPMIQYITQLSQDCGKYEATMAQAIFMFSTEFKQRDVWVQVLTQFIDEEPNRPEIYYLLISHHLAVAITKTKPAQEYQSALNVAERLYTKVQSFNSFSEKLLATKLYVKCLLKAGKVQKALFLLQEQYVQTPHYISLLYLYGKYIVKARVKDLYSSAIGALSEVVRHGVWKRHHNALFYTGMAYENQGLLETAFLYYSRYLKGGSAKQVSEKIGPLRKFTKESYISKFQETSLDELNLVSIQAKIDIKDSIAINKKKDSGEIEFDKKASMNPLIMPVEPLVPQNDLGRDNLQSESMLLAKAKQILDSNRLDKFQVKAKILLAFLQPKQSGAFLKSFKKLLAFTQALDVDKLKASEVWPAMVKQHVLIKMQLKLIEMPTMHDLFTSKTNFEFGQLSIHADRLLMLVEKQNLIESVPSNQWAKMVKNAAQCFWKGYSVQRNKQGLLKALTTMLKLRNLMPAIDTKLANPRLPVDIDKHIIVELEYLDFSLQEKLSPEMTAKAENLFSASAFFKNRLIMGTSHENSIQEVEDHIIHGDTVYAQRRSATPLITLLKIVKEYLPEGKGNLPQDLSEITTRDKGFAVYSDPHFLYEIAGFCLDAKCYYDLALQCLKEYITALTYFKEFNQNVDLVLTKRRVIIQLSRCLTNVGDLDKARKFLEEIETVVRKEYIEKKGNPERKIQYEMFVTAKADLDVCLKNNK